jgi:hypothetical protein
VPGLLRASILLPVLVATLGSVALGLPPPDSDGDGLPDRWERNHELDPHRADAERDPDGDKLSNGLEYSFRGDPHDPDTDGDGLRDGPEVTRWHTAVNVRDQIVGRALGSGLCPTGSASQPCELRPLFAVTVILRDRSGEEVAGAVTHTNGRFSLRARRGTFMADTEHIAGFTSSAPAAAAVRSKQREPARLRFEFRASTGPGVVGQATRSPTCPVERIGDECVAPLGNALIHIEDASGSTVASWTTGEDGYYAFSLDPGSYRLVGESFDSGFPIAPEPVGFVVTGQDTGPSWIPLDYDTGIR